MQRDTFRLKIWLFTLFSTIQGLITTSVIIINFHFQKDIALKKGMQLEEIKYKYANLNAIGECSTHTYRLLLTKILIKCKLVLAYHLYFGYM